MPASARARIRLFLARPIIIIVLVIILIAVHLIVAALVRGRHRAAHLGKVHPRQQRLEEDGHRIALVQRALRIELRSCANCHNECTTDNR